MHCERIVTYDVEEKFKFVGREEEVLSAMQTGDTRHDVYVEVVAPHGALRAPSCCCVPGKRPLRWSNRAPDVLSIRLKPDDG